MTISPTLYIVLTRIVIFILPLLLSLFLYSAYDRKKKKGCLNFMSYLFHLLRTKLFLWILLIINIAGTIYGYIWYGYQLAETPAKFLIFVPDSPNASLFFVVVLIYFLLGKNNGLMEALALVSLFKYGIWAIMMNVLLLVVEGNLDWTGYMLMASHLGMAIQGLLYAPFYRIKPWHLVVTAIWTVHNEMIDYVFGMMPNYGSLNIYYQPIGYATFWLSIISIGIAYFLCVKKNHLQLPLC